MPVWAKNADVIVWGTPYTTTWASGNYYIYTLEHTLEQDLFLGLCIPHS